MDPTLRHGEPTNDEKEALSLLPECRVCAFKCCTRGGSPIVSAEERAAIIAHDGRDFFTALDAASDQPAYVIGKKLDGHARDLSAEACPYLADDGKCSIQDVKPLDCRLYPLKPFYRPDHEEAELAIDVRCPAAGRLNRSFLETSASFRRVFLAEHSEAHLRRYVAKHTRWPASESGVQSLLADATEIELLVCLGVQGDDERSLLEEGVVAMAPKGDERPVGRALGLADLPFWLELASAEGSGDLAELLEPIRQLASTDLWHELRFGSSDDSTLLFSPEYLGKYVSEIQAEVTEVLSYGVWKGDKDRCRDPHLVFRVGLTAGTEKLAAVRHLAERTSSSLRQEEVTFRLSRGGEWWSFRWNHRDSLWRPPAPEQQIVLRFADVSTLARAIADVESEKLFDAITVEVRDATVVFRAPTILPDAYSGFSHGVLSRMFLRREETNRLQPHRLGGEARGSHFFPIAHGIDIERDFSRTTCRSLRFKYFPMQELRLDVACAAPMAGCACSSCGLAGDCSCGTCMGLPLQSECARGAARAEAAVATGMQPPGFCAKVVPSVGEAYFLPLHSGEPDSEAAVVSWLHDYWRLG